MKFLFAVFSIFISAQAFATTKADMDAALSDAISQGASNTIKIVVRHSTGGSEQDIQRIIYLKGGKVLSPVQSTDAEKIVLEID